MEELEKEMKARGFRQKTIKAYSQIFKQFRKFCWKDVADANENTMECEINFDFYFLL